MVAFSLSSFVVVDNLHTDTLGSTFPIAISKHVQCVFDIVAGKGLVLTERFEVRARANLKLLLLTTCMVQHIRLSCVYTQRARD